MISDSNLASASPKGLLSFVLCVIGVMAQISTLKQLRQTMAVQTVMRQFLVRKHL